jgi:predicted HAD superfamily Cof-like phosphohydrolase
METNFTKVCNFNKSFGLPHFDTLQLDIFENTSLVNLRKNLINEEIEELNDAFKTHNFTEVIDALSDILYVVYGAGSSFGINIDETFEQIFKIYEIEIQHKISNSNSNNNNNKSQENLKLQLQNNYEMVKKFITDKTNYNIPLTVQSNIFSLDKTDTLTTNIDNILKDLNKENTIFNSEIDNKNLNVITVNLNSLLFITYKIGILLGIDLNSTFSIVHESNMSKLCKTEQEAIDTVEWYKINEKRYDSPEYRKSDFDNYYVVFNKSTGKILKSINYTPAKFD